MNNNKDNDSLRQSMKNNVSNKNQRRTQKNLKKLMAKQAKIN